MATTRVPAHRDGKVQPAVVRITHWINAFAMVLMIGSGWRIFNDYPLIPGFIFHPDITLGGDVYLSQQRWQDSGMGGALQWHFAGMWLLVLNGLIYFTYGFWSGRFRLKLLPVTLGGLARDIGDALRFRLAHEIGVYNQVQRLLYIGVLTLGVLIVLSGLAIWKPVQLWWLTDLFYGFQGARWVHFTCMVGIVLFLVVHVALALLVPRTILSMITGNAHDHGRPAPQPQTRE
jgi:thiosulfate reductase cytochrome b subunit